MITWTDFNQQQPALADAGRRQFYQFGIGLAFLATVRTDGAPRVHPVCPVISDAGLHLLIVAGPKQQDLRRDGRTRCTAKPARRLAKTTASPWPAGPTRSPTRHCGRWSAAGSWPNATARSGQASTRTSYSN